MFKKSVLLFLATVLSNFSDAKMIKEEGRGRVTKAFSYTILQDDKDFTNRDVILFFHGMGASSNQVVDYHKHLSEAWKADGFSPPRFISISFGPQWALATKNSSPQSGLMEVVLKEVLPKLQRKLIQPEVAQWHVAGMSMGGLNAWQIATQVPEMFSKVVLFSPAFHILSPYHTTEEQFAYQDVVENKFKHLMDGYSQFQIAVAIPMQAGRLAPLLPSKSAWNRFDPTKRVERICPHYLRDGELPDVTMYLGTYDILFRHGSSLVTQAGKEVGWPLKMKVVKQSGHSLEQLNWTEVARIFSKGR